MGKSSKRYSLYKSQPKVFKVLLNFLNNGPDKNTFEIFEILKIEILFFFSFSLTWDPLTLKISKRYSSYKLQLKVYKLVLDFPPNVPHKTTFWDF